LGFAVAATGIAAENGPVSSPDGTVSAMVSLNVESQVVYAVTFCGRGVLAPAPIGVTVDGRDLGAAKALKRLDTRDVHTRFPVRGVHAEGRYDARVALFSVVPVSGDPYGLQVVVSEQGFAWRLLISGAGVHRVNAESACWRLPYDSTVWFGERCSAWKLKTYAGEWIHAPLSELSRVSPQGPMQTMPLVAELPGHLGYALVSEAGLFNYSGLRLEAQGDGSLWGRFTEKDGFAVDGRIVTPWRVTVLASSLDALVNSDLIEALAPPPDPQVFNAADDWTAGGRSVWSWWQGDEGYLTVPAEMHIIDCASWLTFEFTTVDEGWEKWPNAWDALTDLCEYGRSRKVRVFVWKHSKELNLPSDDYAVLRDFLDRVARAGAAGVKIDFMNSESYDTIAFDERVLREAAKRRLLVNFHGCQKPSGESRTYPNEVSREAVRGMELNRITADYEQRQRAAGGTHAARAYVPGGENQNLPASHNAALPFTRCVVGHADYTPVGFSRPGDTTWAHQLAMAYLLTSPLMVMAEDPRRLLAEPRLSPVIPFLRELPTTWDETRVLDGSRIGELAAFARRKGAAWYVAMANGAPQVKVASFSPQFTGWRRTRLSLIADVHGRPSDLTSASHSVADNETVMVTLEPGGGFVAKLERE
jgi:alpha-glucosidase